MIWFIRYLSVAVFLWNYWGKFIDWMLDKWYKQEDELLWIAGLLIIMITGIIITIKVYR